MVQDAAPESSPQMVPLYALKKHGDVLACRKPNEEGTLMKSSRLGH